MKNIRKNIFLSTPFLIAYYFVARQLFGLDYSVIYGFVIVLLILRLSFELIALLFLIISLIVYVMGGRVEANHYFSFVYGLLFLSFIKHAYNLVKERISK